MFEGCESCYGLSCEERALLNNSYGPSQSSQKCGLEGVEWPPEASVGEQVLCEDVSS